MGTAFKVKVGVDSSLFYDVDLAIFAAIFAAILHRAKNAALEAL